MGCSTAGAQNNLIYGGTAQTRILGGGRSTELLLHPTLIWDFASNEAVSIGAFTLNGGRLYVVNPLQKYQILATLGTLGQTYTEFIKAEAPSTQYAGILSEAVFGIGKNVPLRVGNMSVNAPRAMTWTAHDVDSLSNRSDVQVSIATTTYVLDARATLSSNAAGESVTDAVNRISSILESKGYVRITAPPAH